MGALLAGTMAAIAAAAAGVEPGEAQAIRKHVNKPEPAMLKARLARI
jgi:hypothetical protein